MNSEHSRKAKICIVVAISAADRAIGKEGKLLWHIPDDMKRFKQLTLGHPVIMGRKTFDSILSYLGNPLPDRTNIVVTRSNISIDGCLVHHSIEDALAYAHTIEENEIHIGGGSEIYREVLPHVDRLYLTLVHDTKEADAYFPEYDEFTTEIFREEHEHNGLKYTWLTLEK